MTWFAIAGGLAAWTLQLLASYALIEFGCARETAGAALVAPAGAALVAPGGAALVAPGGAALVAPGGAALVAPLLAVSAVAALIAAAATVVAARRALSTRGARRALYVAGALLDALSLVTIAFGAALPVLFAPCLRS